MDVTITTIVPTCGREELKTALDSLASQSRIPGDQVLVIGDGPQPQARAIVEAFDPSFEYHEFGPTGHWGNEQREYAVKHLAKGKMLHFLDDDDIATPEAYDVIRRYANQYPYRPLIFKTLHKWRQILWKSPSDLGLGRTGGSQFVTPNDPERLGSYAPTHIYEADWNFIESTLAKWPGSAPVWCDQVICICSPAVDNRWTV